MSIYVQKDSGSKGQRVEVSQETDFKVMLKNVANGMEFSVGKKDFERHYVDEVSGKPMKFAMAVKNDEGNDDEGKSNSNYRNRRQS